MTKQRKTLTLKRKTPTDGEVDPLALLSKKGRLVVPKPKEKSGITPPANKNTKHPELTSVKAAAVTPAPVTQKNNPKPAKPMAYEAANAKERLSQI